MKRKRGKEQTSEVEESRSASSTSQEKEGEPSIKLSDLQPETPTKRRSTRVASAQAQKLNGTPNKASSASGTPTKLSRPSQIPRASILLTPTKRRALREHHSVTPTRRRAAEHSARKKSVRRLVEDSIWDIPSDEEDLREKEQELAREILDCVEEDEVKKRSKHQARQEHQENQERQKHQNHQEHQDISENNSEDDRPPDPSRPFQSLSTPQHRKTQARAKAPRSKRTPTPPPTVDELPPHELYFYQNRPGGNKTSNNTLGSVPMLNHEEYFSLTRDLVDSHQAERDFLHELHARSFPQWRFELSEGFSLCLYGWGSKRKLTNDFAEWLYPILNAPHFTTESTSLLQINSSTAF